MPADAELARRIVQLSRAQNGAITTGQLHAVGLTRHAIAARVARGRLVPLHRGVYAVGDPGLMPLVRPAGALLSIAATAVLSHRSAAAIWGLAVEDPQTTDVTVADGKPRPRPGVRLHRVRRLDPRDTATRSNLRLTSPARTMIDFAAQAATAELGDAFGEARAKRLLTDGALAAALGRVPRNHPGAAIIRAMLREGGTYDRSRAELLMRRLCRRAQLPQPMVNVRLGGFLVDFYWPDHRLIVEVDGYGTHGSRQAFESDRRRDQVHAAAGYLVIRVTWRQLQDEPLAVIARIAQAMAQRAA